jgi:hypothetical protein
LGSKDTNREQEAAETKKILETLREAKRRVKATPASFDSDLDEKFWKERFAPLVKNVSSGTSAMITESGVSAARQANAPYDWFVDWAKKDLPDLVAQGNIKAHIEIGKRENTWLTRAKKAFWYVVGIIATAIVTYYVALAGFKV